MHNSLLGLPDLVNDTVNHCPSLSHLLTESVSACPNMHTTLHISQTIKRSCYAGPARTVEFDFDMGADTAMSVASEMVEDLSLSHNDAIAIAAAIKQEIKQLTGQAPMFSVVER